MGRRPMPHTQAKRDQILAILREHEALTTSQVGEQMGEIECVGCDGGRDPRSWCGCRGTGRRTVSGYEAYKVLAPMEKLGLVAGFRARLSEVLWMLPAFERESFDEFEEQFR